MSVIVKITKPIFPGAGTFTALYNILLKIMILNAQFPDDDYPNTGSA
jgi:hypothetical protein